MAAQTVIDLRNLNGRKEFLTGTKIEQAINQACLREIARLRSMWSSGKDGAERRFKDYTPQYKKWKKGETGGKTKLNASNYSGKVDLILYNQLHPSIRFKKLSRLNRAIQPLGANNIKKMEGLTSQRNGIRKDIMKVSDKGRKKFLTFIYKELIAAKSNNKQGA